MHTIVDRLLMLACCAALFSGQPSDVTVVAALLTAVTVSGLNGYLASPGFRLASIAAYTAASAVWPGFCLFFPLVYYDAFAPRQAWWALVAAAGLAVCFTSLPLDTSLMVTVLTAAACALRHRADALGRSQTQLTQLRDDGHELAMALQQKNRELLEKQDYEIRLATLGERSRIAREIHDHVGHLLSRSILQVGAIMAAQRKAGAGSGPTALAASQPDTESGGADPHDDLQQSLSAIRDTLSQAMNSIRASVHDLHEESLDLRVQMEALAQDFTFCPIRLDYNLETQPDKEVAYCFIAIVKEGLSNIIRHSNARLVSLTLLEHPALYQLVLEDNGSRASGEAEGADGLGLRNMADRVAALGGQFLIRRDGGFRLFISIPKGGRMHESVGRRR